MAEHIVWNQTAQNLTVVVDGQSYLLNKEGNEDKFLNLREACAYGNLDKVREILNIDMQKLKVYQAGGVQVKSEDGIITLDGEDLPAVLGEQLLKLAEAKLDFTPLVNFWNKLKKNPSYRSVNQLFEFLYRYGFPLYEDGDFKAYKGVTKNLKDIHTGTIDNSPGETIRMERNLISDDPDHACHVGLHVGAIEYADNFRRDGLLLEVKVNPEHVVCVPKDHAWQKIRVCEYEVIQVLNPELGKDMDLIVGGGTAYNPRREWESEEVDEDNEDNEDNEDDEDDDDNYNCLDCGEYYCDGFCLEDDYDEDEDYYDMY
jgi:hypothetical protein